MSLQDNLDLAREVIEEIADLDIQSSNKVSHRLRRAGGANAAIRAAAAPGGHMTGMDDQGALGAAVGAVRGLPAASLRAEANNTIAAGVGNCHELATIALIMMYDEGIAPVHLMWFTNDAVYGQGKQAGQPMYDHVWATIGVHEGAQPDDVRSWGDEAVWVDPWQGDNGICFSIKDFVAGKVRNLNALYRCDTPLRVELGEVAWDRYDP